MSNVEREQSWVQQFFNGIFVKFKQKFWPDMTEKTLDTKQFPQNTVQGTRLVSGPS